MRKILPLLAGLIAVFYVVSSFIDASQTQILFGQEINIWLYRLIWAAVGVLIFYGYYKRTKAEQNGSK